MIPGTCPDCGSARPLPDFLADADARAALVAALAVPAPLARSVVAYLSLHAPVGRRVQMGKLARLLRELSDLLNSGEVTRRAVTHAAPHDLWAAALEAVLATHQAGGLTLPLEGHGYLLAVAHGLAAKGQTAAGRTARGETPVGQHPSHQPAAPAALGCPHLPQTPRQAGPVQVGALLSGLRRRATDHQAPDPLTPTPEDPS